MVVVGDEATAGVGAPVTSDTVKETIPCDNTARRIRDGDTHKQLIFTGTITLKFTKFIKFIFWFYVLHILNH
jgi:hypothetical protein